MLIKQLVLILLREIFLMYDCSLKEKKRGKKKWVKGLDNSGNIESFFLGDRLT